MSELPPPLPTTPRRSFWRTPLGRMAMVAIVLATVVALGLVTIGVAMELGYLPDTKAVAGSQLATATLGTLRDHGLIEPGEEVIYFYSDGIFSVLEDGNLFTPRRVISYWQDERGELQVATAEYGEIAAIEPRWSSSWLENTTIDVTTDTGFPIVLYVSTEDGRDRDFYARLVETWKRHR